MKIQKYLLIICLFAVAACSSRLSNHAVIKSTVGTPVSSAKMIASMAHPGILSFKKILSMQQYSRRSEQIILDESAVDAGIVDADETIDISFYAIRHPTKGLFLIDAGMPENYLDYFGFIAKKFMSDVEIKMIQNTNHWIKEKAGMPLSGIFLTHLHFDHAMGVAATPINTPIYVGPNDGSQTDFGYRIAGGPDKALKGRAAMRELVFQKDAAGRFEGVLDIFGDGSLYAILVPGHTPGSLAFLVNSTAGPKLITGDTVRTKLEWTHNLKPAWYVEGSEVALSKSAALLRSFVVEHPEVEVHLGHQSLSTGASLAP